MTSHTLTTHVKSATWIQERAGELKKQDIDAPELLLKKSHPVWLVFKNITNFPLSKTDQYFNTGDWFDNVVPEIAPWSVAGIAAADQWGGCTGGASFKLHLENDLDFDFSIGFTDPLKGWNKMCCIAGKDTKAAYSRANSNDEDSTFKSPDHYIATTNTEKTVRFQFQVSVSRLGVLSGKKDSCKIYVTVQQIPY